MRRENYVLRRACCTTSALLLACLVENSSCFRLSPLLSPVLLRFNSCWRQASRVDESCGVCQVICKERKNIDSSDMMREMRRFLLEDPTKSERQTTTQYRSAAPQRSTPVSKIQYCTSTRGRASSHLGSVDILAEDLELDLVDLAAILVDAQDLLMKLLTLQRYQTLFLRKTKTCSLSLVVCSHEYISNMHSEWKGEDSSIEELRYMCFPQSVGGTLGDLVISYESALWVAQKENSDVNYELRSFLVDGVLALIGISDEVSLEEVRSKVIRDMGWKDQSSWDSGSVRVNEFLNSLVPKQARENQSRRSSTTVRGQVQQPTSGTPTTFRKMPLLEDQRETGGSDGADNSELKRQIGDLASRLRRVENRMTRLEEENKFLRSKLLQSNRDEKSR